MLPFPVQDDVSIQAEWEVSKIRPLLEQRTDYWYKMKYRSRMELINMVFRQGGEHKFAYDWETLDMLLREQLFSTVTHESFGIGSMEKLCLDRPERASESIYVEAHKPRLGIALAPRG